MPVSSWIPSSVITPCPVCGRTEDGDCVSSDDGLTVLCHSKVSQSGRIAVPDDRVGDWVFTGKVESKGVMSRAVYVKERERTGGKKPVRSESKQAFLYPAPDGRPLARTKRVDDGKGEKFIWQEYWSEDDRLRRHRPKSKEEKNSYWVCVSQTKVKAGKATAAEREIYQEIVAERQKLIHLYRISEARDLAKTSGLPVLIVEGEGLVNALIELGIPATTNIGGGKKWHQYGGKHGNYKADLKGLDVVLCPDCDRVGVEHMAQVAGDTPTAQWLYANPTHRRWQQDEPSGGYDLKDWIDELKADNWQDEAIRDRIMGAVGARREFRFETEKARRDDEKAESQQASLDFSTPSTDGDGAPIHKLKADYLTICAAIGDQLRFNALKNSVEMNGKEIEVETAKQELVIEHDLWLKSGKEEVADLVVKAAKRNTYNPIQDYLTGCHEKYGSDTSILYSFADRYFGQPDPIYTIFTIRFLIGAVARIFEPGCKFDNALILQGGQGIRKSTFFKILAGREWFDDSLGNTSDKDEKMKLHQTWFMEWAELETVFKRKDVSQTKAFLSSDHDRLRLPYGRSIVEMKRRCVIVGTTNQDEFLNDVTGNRRFWVVPVKVPCIDTSTLAEERDRIWAAAVELYKRGEFWHLSDFEDQAAGMATEEYQSEDAWSQPIEQWLRHTTGEITTSSLLSHALKLEISRQDKAAQMRVSDIMKSLGWEKTRKRVNGENLRIWQPSKEAVPTSLEVGTEVGTFMDLSKSSLYQYFYRSKDSNVPTVPTVPTYLENQDENRKNDQLATSIKNGAEKTSLRKTSGTDGTVGTGKEKSAHSNGSERSNLPGNSDFEVGTSQNGGWNNSLEKLERSKNGNGNGKHHTLPVASSPTLEIGRQAIDQRNGKVVTVTKIDGEWIDFDGENISGTTHCSNLTPLPDPGTQN